MYYLVTSTYNNHNIKIGFKRHQRHHQSCLSTQTLHQKGFEFTTQHPLVGLETGCKPVLFKVKTFLRDYLRQPKSEVMRQKSTNKSRYWVTKAKQEIWNKFWVSKKWHLNQGHFANWRDKNKLLLHKSFDTVHNLTRQRHLVFLFWTNFFFKSQFLHLFKV